MSISRHIRKLILLNAFSISKGSQNRLGFVSVLFSQRSILAVNIHTKRSGSARPPARYYGRENPRQKAALARPSAKWRDNRADNRQEVRRLPMSLSRQFAAFVNAEMILAGGKWDAFRMLTHPGTAILPAALVAAEVTGCSGKDFLTGV